MYSVDLKNVTKKWGDVTAVDEVIFILMKVNSLYF